MEGEREKKKNDKAQRKPRTDLNVATRADLIVGVEVAHGVAAVVPVVLRVHGDVVLVDVAAPEVFFVLPRVRQEELTVLCK